MYRREREAVFGQLPFDILNIRRGKAMSKQKKQFIPVVVLCVIIIICIVLTGMIVMNMLPAKADVMEGTYTLQNVYVTGSDNGKVTFCYEGKIYEFDGKLKDRYTGIADVKVEDGAIQKLYTKPDYVTGVLNSYTDSQMDIGDLGIVERNEELPVYVVSDRGVTQGEFEDLVVGTANLTYIFENGTVCALLAEEAQEIQDIRVLIKNGSNLTYDSLYLSASKAWKLNGTKIKAGKAQNVADAFTEEGTKSVTATCKNGKLYLCDSNGNAVSNQYEGSFIIRKTDNGYVVINELPLETYVRYVLPSEMPSSFSYEALKAQAVCARTFAYTQMKGGDYAEYGANLDDSTSYQVYNSGECTEQTDKAVEETAGQVLTCDGKMIVCYYFSTSPGITENLEVWGNEESPEYLSPQNGILDGKDRDLSSEETFSAFIHESPESYDSASAFYRWTATLNLANITDEEYGTLKKIEVGERSRSGFITSLLCTFSNGSKRLTNENEIRTFLGKALKTLTLADGNERDFTTIPSACFEITKIDGYQVTLTGGGFGHDVGMSQYGASAMGNAGKNYQEILSFYYPNTAVSSMK